MENLMRFDVTNERNLTMLVDFYELTMANGYFNKGVEDRIAYFDTYFRRVPDGGGYCIMAGVDQLIQYLNSLKFTESDIKYLESKNIFSEEFLNDNDIDSILKDIHEIQTSDEKQKNIKKDSYLILIV